MGVAALVLGIISILISWIPCVGSLALIPAIVGLILGIVDTVQKSKKGEKKGLAIAGIVLTAIAIVVIIIMSFILPSIAAKKIGDTVNSTDWNEVASNLNEFANSLNSIDWNTYDYN